MSAVVRCCHCGRTGTRGFQLVPAQAFSSAPHVWECIARAACLQRLGAKVP